MLSVAREVPWDDYVVAIPAFLTMVVMPFSYSITGGIGVGFITYVLLAYAAGRRRSVHWMLLLSALLFVLYFAAGPFRALLGMS